jgi:predicted methyltransferase MtxX (methanogen marker protein 4)
VCHESGAGVIEEKAVIDRIVDGRYAVLLIGDAEEEKVILAENLPSGAVPGTWLRAQFRGGELLQSSIDADETETVKVRVATKMELLRQRKRRRSPDQ